MDFLLLGITVVLTMFGLAMIASVSVFESFQLTQRLTGVGSNSFYLVRSFLHAILGCGAMAFTILVPYHFWEKHARSIFFLTIILTMGVLVPGISAGWGSASHWLRIGPLSLQPSEFLKLGMIFYLALWLQKREQLVDTFREGFIPFALLLVICTLVVAIEPDLGSFLVLATTGCVMFFIAGGNLIHLLGGGFLAATMGLPLMLQKKYIQARFLAFFNPNDPTIGETIGFQIKQAIIAIGSGGPLGLGYGKSVQKFGYLPEVQSDMIFSAMAEELGFFRLLIVLSMFGLLIWRGYKIAQNAPDRFGFLVASGITSMLAIQTLVNIAVNVGLFPLTGITLPFVSYGGSSLIASLAAVGILLNISMYSTEEVRLARRTKKGAIRSISSSIFSAK
jgi:cell division protein FtsW